MFVFRTRPAAAAKCLFSVIITAGSVSLGAADWHTVMGGKTEVIQFDRDRIAAAPSGILGSGGLLGWSRIRLNRNVNDPGGTYNAIHAQNLYDCEGRRFTTLRRVYFNGDTLIREEAAARQRPMTVQPGSIDERLLNEACREATVGRFAEADDGAVRSAADTSDSDRILPMHADMRTLADKGGARVVPVADAHGAEKPKRIEMPAIDKVAADAAAAATATRPIPPTGATPVAAHSAPAAAPAVAHAPAAPAAHAALSPMTNPNPVEKRVRELQYATSGPPRKVKKKPVENPAHQMHVHWAYEGEGAPANWGKLQPSYATCASGKRQSPIDIREGIKVDLNGIRFDYRPTLFNVVDNGHTVQVNVDEGQSITIMGKRYDLIQFHFHRPSEERVNGRSYDMVVHLVHKNDDGNLAVVAVLLERGTEHPVIQSIWNSMPLEKGAEVTSEVAINLANLLPENRAYWTYMGSLTTPPCSENVLWMVLKQAVQISPEQVSIFSRMYRNNARPVQPSYGRLVKETR